MVRTMYEFSSISVSSYDAASLADKLTERSSEGWDVVAIVPAGTNVTAYLRRATLGAGGVTESESGVGDVAAAAAAAGAVDVTEGIVDDDTGIAALGASDAASPVEEPAGWAIAPESSESELEPEPEPEPESFVSSGAVVSATVAGAVTAGAEQQSVQQQASASAAPAGWYADPSTRYELRYWDGSQWTEHVSRAGQQYTDPPVA